MIPQPREVSGKAEKARGFRGCSKVKLTHTHIYIFDIVDPRRASCLKVLFRTTEDGTFFISFVHPCTPVSEGYDDEEDNPCTSYPSRASPGTVYGMLKLYDKPFELMGSFSQYSAGKKTPDLPGPFQNNLHLIAEGKVVIFFCMILLNSAEGIEYSVTRLHSTISRGSVAGQGFPKRWETKAWWVDHHVKGTGFEAMAYTGTPGNKSDLF